MSDARQTAAMRGSRSPSKSDEISMSADPIQAAKERLTRDATVFEDRINAVEVCVILEKPPRVRYLGDVATDLRMVLAEISRLEGGGDAEAVKDRKATDEHVLRVAAEARDGLAALEEIDACWDAYGTAGNRDNLTLSEQIASTLRELEDARHDYGNAESEAKGAEADNEDLKAALAEARRQIAERDEALKACDRDFKTQGFHELSHIRSLIAASLLSTEPAGGGEKAVTMLIDQDWLSRHVATDPDASVEAGRSLGIARDTIRLPAKQLTDAELITEQTRVEELWDGLHEPDEFGEVSGHGGSPGEWMVERMDEVATEQACRAAMQTKAEAE